MSTDRQLRVLRVLPTLGTGGTEKQCLEVVEELQRLSASGELAKGRAIQIDLATVYAAPTAHQLPLPAGTALHQLNQPRSIAGLWHAGLALRPLMRQYDCIHAMLWPAVWAAALAGGGVPWLASIHGTAIKRGPLGAKLLADRLFYARANRLLFNSEAGRGAVAPLLGRDPRQCDVIVNGKREYSGPWPARSGVVCLARVQPPKRHELLLDALAVMDAATRPAVRFIGQQTQDEAFLALIAARNLTGVLGIGEVDDPLPLLAAADVLALPSDSEGMPNAILEAWSCGTVVLASNVPGIRELMRDGVDGLLVENTPLAWCAGLERLLAERTLREQLAAAGRERLAREFSLSAVAQEWARLYAELAASQR